MDIWITWGYIDIIYHLSISNVAMPGRSPLLNGPSLRSATTVRWSAGVLRSMVATAGWSDISWWMWCSEDTGDGSKTTSHEGYEETGNQAVAHQFPFRKPYIIVDGEIPMLHHHVHHQHGEKLGWSTVVISLNHPMHIPEISHQYPIKTYWNHCSDKDKSGFYDNHPIRIQFNPYLWQLLSHNRRNVT